MSFVLSKLAWALISPGSLLTFLLAIGLVLARYAEGPLRRSGRKLCAFVACCFLAIAIFPVGEWALLPLENRVPSQVPDQIYGIIILGGDEKPAITEARGMPVALDSMRRYATFAELARKFPDARLVFTGGSGLVSKRSDVLDSEVAYAFLSDFGVPADGMIFERTSRNTYENAVFTADIVRPEPAQKWVLVTSAWHMPRAIGCFKRAGWNVYAAPTGYFTEGTFSLHPDFAFAEQMRMLTMAMHEYVGLISYRLMGRTNALWPQ